ncbi:NADPH:quinone oxidoreductase family protein [Algiphilus sp.]|uniref:NADPH:quinone oxidoreductase family protein n=1 Tax=Algiphilus sp. TaxID=1872431 RepID=UPI003B51BE45
MRAVVCKSLGPPDNLVVEEKDDLTPKANEVCIKVHACGVNFPDTLIVEGKYQLRPEPPFIPGAEVAGEVLSVGEKVRHVRPGDRVTALVQVGGFADQACAAGEAVMPIPNEMNYTQASAFPLVYGTVMHALRQRGALQAGETLLVLGAGGGVGLAAVQLGKIMGAKVIAAAGTQEKLSLAKHYGADEAINYSYGSFKDNVKKLTNGQGADVIFDPVGGDLGQECLSCINWRGRYLVIGFAAGDIPHIAANRLLLKGASAVGVFWGAFVAREPKVNFENFEQLFEWFSEGKLRPHISKTYPLEDAAQALADMRARRVTGKVALLP